MLVLTRKQGEEIRIRDDIVVRIVGLQGCRVSIGITAPVGVSIIRTAVAPAKAPAIGSASPAASKARKAAREIIER